MVGQPNFEQGPSQLVPCVHHSLHQDLLTIVNTAYYLYSMATLVMMLVLVLLMMLVLVLLIILALVLVRVGLDH
jgi:hypothetical protein